MWGGDGVADNYQNENIQGCEKLWIPLILNTCYGPLTQERLGKYGQLLGKLNRLLEDVIMG